MGLSVKAEPLPKSQLRLEISVGAEECTAAWNSVLSDLNKRSSIPGFRKGRAPKQVVISQYGRDTILASACEEVIEKSIQKALKDSGVSAIGQAEVDQDGGVDSIIKDYSPDADLTFCVKVDVWPEATFTGPYDNLEIEAEEVPLDEKLIDLAMEDLRRKESFPVLAPAGATAALGQTVVADLVGYFRNEDGTKGDRLPDIADGKSIEINMNEGQYMPGFVEGVVGAVVGEMRDVNVEFPMRNARPELAGVKAAFEITIHAIQDIVLPELNDDFAKQASEEKTLEDLRQAIRERIGTEADDTQEKNINNSIDNVLDAITEVDIPETLVENQVKSKFANMLASFKDKGMPEEQIKGMVSKENYELYKKRALPNVEKTLKVNFAVNKIARDENLIVGKEAVDNQMEFVKAELKGDENIEEDKVRDQIEAQLERELVLIHIKKTAKVTLVPKKVEEEKVKETKAVEEEKVKEAKAVE